MRFDDHRASWYQQMFEATSSAVFVYTLDGKLVDINRAACALHRWTREEMLQKSPHDFIAPESIEVFDAFRHAMGRGEEYRGEARGIRSDGTMFDVEVYGVPIELDGERFAFSSLTDISETVALREKLAEAQRLDAMGRLAGGVAHDFNNMLTIIMGGAEYAQSATDATVVRNALTEILAASMRARELTRQLMSFSRHRAIRRQRVAIDDLLRQTLPLVARVLPENLAFVTDLDEGPFFVEGEPAPLEQVIVNLVLNARDALDGGAGHVTLRARRRVIDAYTVHDLEPGAYLEITVEDDGVGMTKETLSHIFEPFFTTKGSRGTGLGLATAYGIVRQHGGALVVYSELGKGATFRAFLPLVDGATIAVEPAPADIEPELHRGLSIAVVDDEPTVRDLVVRAVERLGARGISVSPSDADAVVMRARPDVLITDIVMPEEDGVTLATRLRLAIPELRVLYFSGYSADHLMRGGLLPPDIDLLSKPFTLAELSLALREVMRRPIET